MTFLLGKFLLNDFDHSVNQSCTILKLQKPFLHNLWLCKLFLQVLFEALHGVEKQEETINK